MDSHEACQDGDLRPAAPKRLKAEGLGQVRMNYGESEPLPCCRIKRKDVVYCAN
jgi:hypothetical protein